MAAQARVEAAREADEVCHCLSVAFHGEDRHAWAPLEAVLRWELELELEHGASRGAERDSAPASQLGFLREIIFTHYVPASHGASRACAAIARVLLRRVSASARASDSSAIALRLLLAELNAIVACQGEWPEPWIPDVLRDVLRGSLGRAVDDGVRSGAARAAEAESGAASGGGGGWKEQRARREWHDTTHGCSNGGCIWHHSCSCHWTGGR